VALITFFSAKGSPGVTTTAMMTAALWPRPCVLVDADPNGGDVALRLPNPEGRPLRSDLGLLSLLPLARRGLAPEAVLDHTQVAMGGQVLLSGLAGPEQAMAVGPLWDELARVFTRLPGHDVIIDAGRAHSTAVHLSLLQQSQIVVGVFRPTVPGVVHLRSRLGSMKDRLAGQDGATPRIGVVCVDDVQRQRESLAAVSGVQAELSWLESFGQVALDPKAAALFDGFPVSRPERTLLVRSGQRLADTLVRSIGLGVGGATVGSDAQEPSDEQRLPTAAGHQSTSGTGTGTGAGAGDDERRRAETRASRRQSRGLLRKGSR
jgi:hypothetical protein